MASQPIEVVAEKMRSRRGRPPARSSSSRPAPAASAPAPAGPPVDDAAARAAQQMIQVTQLSARMLARLPVTLFDLPPALDAAEEAALVEGIVQCADHYMPDWLKNQGPVVMLAGTAGMIYGPRLVDKMERRAAAAKAAQEKARAGVQPSSNPETPHSGGIGMGQDLPSA